MDSGAGLDKTRRHNPTEGPDGPTGPWHLPFLILFLPLSTTALGVTNTKAITEVHQTHAAVLLSVPMGLRRMGPHSPMRRGAHTPVQSPIYDPAVEAPTA